MRCRSLLGNLKSFTSLLVPIWNGRANKSADHEVVCGFGDYSQSVKPIRRMSPAGTYFVTFQTVQRRRLFVVDSYARLFLKTLFSYRREGKFQIHAFVVMPEHVHLLFTPAPGIALERAIQLIKGGYSYRFGIAFGAKEIWQRGFTDHRIRDDEDFAEHREYIHQNPVRRGLVVLAEEYRLSSAYPGYRLDKQTSAAKAGAEASSNGTTKVVPLPDR